MIGREKPLVLCENLVKIYKVADLEVVALQGLDLEVLPGEMIAIVGASGSGKSTLMNMLSAQDLPSAGSCMVDGNDLIRLSEAQRVNYRRLIVGQIWQQSGRNLLPDLSAEENIILPQVLGGTRASSAKQRANELLKLIGMERMGKNKPSQLSGGEQQRVAIAVALANTPKVLLADEPTGELDSTTAGEILTLLRSINKELGLTIIMVTHDAAIAANVDRTIAIRDGRTSTETIRRESPLAERNENILASSAIIGLSSETHRESVLIDRVGRLQLPKEALEHVSFDGRAEVRIVNDHIELWPLNVEGNGNGSGTNSTKEEVR
ncbi:MAG: ABC transporter ATP-binding protein [Chloroflexota bacterium]|nr:ABC transporter ATP-binding protein [Chloroflexota bacterium]